MTTLTKIMKFSQDTGTTKGLKCLCKVNNGDVRLSKSPRRFYNKIQAIKWGSLTKPVYLKVNYDKHADDSGKMTEFWNDGDYSGKEDFTIALNAFLEER